LRNNGGWLILRYSFDSATLGGIYTFGEKSRPKSKVELILYNDLPVFRDAHRLKFMIKKRPISKSENGS
jgi:hypothetical protein